MFDLTIHGDLIISQHARRFNLGYNRPLEIATVRGLYALNGTGVNYFSHEDKGPEFVNDMVDVAACIARKIPLSSSDLRKELQTHDLLQVNHDLCWHIDTRLWLGDLYHSFSPEKLNFDAINAGHAAQEYVSFSRQTQAFGRYQTEIPGLAFALSKRR